MATEKHSPHLSFRLTTPKELFSCLDSSALLATLSMQHSELFNKTLLHDYISVTPQVRYQAHPDFALVINNSGFYAEYFHYLKNPKIELFTQCVINVLNQMMAKQPIMIEDFLYDPSLQIQSEYLLRSMIDDRQAEFIASNKTLSDIITPRSIEFNPVIQAELLFSLAMSPIHSPRDFDDDESILSPRSEEKEEKSDLPQNTTIFDLELEQQPHQPESVIAQPPTDGSTNDPKSSQDSESPRTPGRRVSRVFQKAPISPHEKSSNIVTRFFKGISPRQHSNTSHSPRNSNSKNQLRRSSIVSPRAKSLSDSSNPRAISAAESPNRKPSNTAFELACSPPQHSYLKKRTFSFSQAHSSTSHSISRSKILEKAMLSWAKQHRLITHQRKDGLDVMLPRGKRIRLVNNHLLCDSLQKTILDLWIYLIRHLPTICDVVITYLKPHQKAQNYIELELSKKPNL